MIISTPRTDEVERYTHSNGFIVPADFARQLERELAEAKAELEEAKLACGEFIKPPFADSIPCAIQCISNRCFIAEQSLKNREQANADLRAQLKDMTDQFFAVSQENALLRDKPGSASCLAAANERDSLRAKLTAVEAYIGALEDQCDSFALFNAQRAAIDAARKEAKP